MILTLSRISKVNEYLEAQFVLDQVFIFLSGNKDFGRAWRGHHMETGELFQACRFSGSACTGQYLAATPILELLAPSPASGMPTEGLCNTVDQFTKQTKTSFIWKLKGLIKVPRSLKAVGARARAPFCVLYMGIPPLP